MKRRNFLKACAIGGATIALGKTNKGWASGSFEGYPEAMGILTDTTRCIGCRSCEAACNKEQNLPTPDQPFDDKSVFEEHRRPTSKAYTVVNEYEKQSKGGPVYRKIQCNHCNEPACLTSCFVNAYTKTDQGAVIYNPKICVGCRNCMIACPFNVPGYSYESVTNPVVKKCIMCYDTRLKHGKPPACVDICPQEALVFGHRADLIKLAHERIRANPERYYDHVYGEKELGGTSWLYLSSVPFDKIGFDTTLGNDPIISNVKDFLGMVPMVLSIWPALFSGIHLLSKKTDHDEHGDHHDNAEGGH